MTRLIVVSAISFPQVRPHPPPEDGIALGLPRLRVSPPVSKWRPPSGGFCWLVVTGAAERASTFLALEPGFD